jgi:hypothetical protein
VPNYWDSIKGVLSDTIGDALAVIPKAAMSLAGSTVSRTVPVATQGIQNITEQKNQEISKIAREVATKATDVITKPAEVIRADVAFDFGLGEIDKLYRYVYPKIAQPISTGLLANADFVAGRSIDLANSWNTAKNVSPGQAAANNFSETLDFLGITDYAKKADLPLPTFLDPNFNIADPAQRKKAFEKDIFGRVISGGLDGFVNWYADPLVIVGKAIALGKIKGLDSPITSAEDVVRVRADLDTHGLYVKTEGKIGRETPMGVIANRLVDKTPAEAYDDAFVKRSTNRVLMAGLLGEAKTYDEVADIIGASVGDLTSMKKLEQSRASIADEIRRTQEIIGPIQEQYLKLDFGQAVTFDQHMPTIQEFDRLSKVLDDLKFRDANLSRAMSERVGDYRLVNDYTSAADINLFNKNIGVAIEKARGRGSELGHAASFYTETFQKSPLGRAVHVITLPFNKLPRGIVRIDGGPVAESFNEVKAVLNSTPELRKAEYGLIKNELAREYIVARNATERFAAIENIEEEVANLIAINNGFSLDEAQQFYKIFGNVRRGLMSSFQQHGFWVDDAENLVTSPFWKSEMPNMVPMMDFRDFEKFLKTYKRFGEAGAKGLQVGEELNQMADFANSWFKVSVLTRMGYPIRNTLDGQLRAALVLGSLAKTDDAVRNFAQNLKTRATLAQNFIDETLSLRNPSQLRTQTGKLITVRGQFIDVRSTILDEITAKKYYAGASGTFGQRIEPGAVEQAIASKSKPLLTNAKRAKYFELSALKTEQGGLLFGKDKDAYKRLQSESFGKYVRQEILPQLPSDTTLVYADFPSGNVFYRVPGKTQKRIPSGAIPDIEARRGIPEGMLSQEVQPGQKLNVRAKGPVRFPDIRVITSYEAARSNNYENIAELLGEEQMRRIRFYTEKIDELENKILDKVLESKDLAARRAELKIIRAGEEPEKFITPRGQEIIAEGAFAGPNGALIRGDVSGEGSLNWMTESQAYITYDAVKGMNSKIYAGKLSEKRVVVQPTDPQYFNEMAVFANNILRNDQLAMRILSGEGDTEIAGWLRSKKGEFYLREINADVEASNILEHIQEARARISSIFPDQQIRTLIHREELSPEQFDVLLRGAPDLKPIAGRSFMDDTLRVNTGTIKNVVNQTISKIFKVIGSTPENNLVAWPFYNNLYRKNLQRELDLAEQMGKNLRDEDLVIQMQRSAHAASLKSVNETLYRVANNTGLSSVLRWLVPFFNAQYNAVKVYGKFMLQDPSRLARTALIWNLPNRISTVVDENGVEVPPGTPPSTQQYIIITIPEGMKGKFGLPKGYNISLPKNSLNIFLTGENPLAPSFGLPVTIPVSLISNSRPDKVESVNKFLEEFVGEETSKVIMQTILPFGRAPENPWRLLLPAFGQKVATLNAGLDDATYARSVASAYKTLYYNWDQEGRIAKQPTFKDAQNLADRIYKIRISANLSLPFTFSFKPEWQPIIDDYRRALNNPAIGKTKVDDYILSKYGDIGYLVTAPTSRNRTGLVPTVNAVRNQREHQDLLSRMDQLNVPNLVGFIANFGATSDKFSDAAANYFRGKQVRPGGDIRYTETRATEDVIRDREESLGWYYYSKYTAERDVLLSQYGLKDINSKAAEQLGLKDAWEKSVSSIKEYLPAWGEAKDFSSTDFNSTKRYIKGLIEIASNKKWMDQYGQSNTMQAVSDYLVNRSYLVNQLQERKIALGEGSLSSESNSDLKEAWDNYILGLKLWSPGFTDLYVRNLENDNYGVIK